MSFSTDAMDMRWKTKKDEIATLASLKRREAIYVNWLNCVWEID